MLSYSLERLREVTLVGLWVQTVEPLGPCRFLGVGVGLHAEYEGRPGLACC